MKKKILSIAALSLVVAGAITYTVLAGPKLFPVIKNFGAIHDVPFAVHKPDVSLDYKIIIDIGAQNEKPGEIYFPLEHAARMYNLHAHAGIPQKKIDAAIAIWGESITVALNNEAYKAKYGVDNPNIKILAEMKQAGVKIFGCGQSVLRLGINPKDLNPDVAVAFSRFTLVSEYQMKGYAYFKY
jgi:intracellular sulfur oxidation DsrE/DsrF family protein